MFEDIGEKTAWPIRHLGYGLKINKSAYIDIDDLSEYRILGVTSYGKGVTIKKIVEGARLTMKRYQIVSDNQLMWCKVDTKNGAFGVTYRSHIGALASSNMSLADINLEVFNSNFLQMLFRLPRIYESLTNASLGTTNRKYLKPQEVLGKIRIHLPPLQEQNRIVAKIDSLNEKINQAKNLRQQAIKETETLIHSTLNELLKEVAKNPSCQLGPICAFAEVNPSRAGNVNLSPSDLVSFVPMRAVDDVMGTIARPESRPYAEVAKGYTWFKDGDVIFARITPCMQNGKSAIACNLANGVGFGSTEFHVIRPGPQIMAEWLYSIVRHKAFRDDAATHFKGTAGQQRVPQSFMEQKEIYVPSLTEQRRIVAYLDTLQAKIDSLKKLQAETEKELNALLPSILDKAFKGELVTSSAEAVSIPISEVKGKPEKGTPYKDDAALVCVLLAEMQKYKRPTTEFFIQKHIFAGKYHWVIPVNSNFIRKTGGPWSHELKQKAIFAGERMNWLRWEKGKLIPGRSFERGLEYGRTVFGAQVEWMTELVADLKNFGNEGLGRWMTVLKVVTDLKTQGQTVSRDAIQREIDNWPGKRMRREFSRENVDHTIDMMQRQKWITLD